MGWEVGGRLKREETCIYTYGWSMLMYGRNQCNIVIILQLQIKIFFKIRQLSKATLISLLKGSWGVWGHCQRLSISICSWSQQKWKILFYGLPWGSKGSVQFSRSAVSNSLQPHGPQHTRPPCPSPTPGVYSNSGSGVRTRCFHCRWVLGQHRFDSWLGKWRSRMPDGMAKNT